MTSSVSFSKVVCPFTQQFFLSKAICSLVSKSDAFGQKLRQLNIAQMPDTMPDAFGQWLAVKKKNKHLVKGFPYT